MSGSSPASFRTAQVAVFSEKAAFPISKSNVTPLGVSTRTVSTFRCENSIIAAALAAAVAHVPVV